MSEQQDQAFEKLHTAHKSLHDAGTYGPDEDCPSMAAFNQELQRLGRAWEKAQEAAFEAMDCEYCHEHQEKPTNGELTGLCDKCGKSICEHCGAEESPILHSSCRPSEDDSRESVDNF